MKLFDVAKIGCYCESVTHATEKRKDGETKVIQLTLRVQPFDAKLATAVSTAVRNTLFKIGHPDPHEHLQRVSFGLGVPRQQLLVFSTPDTVRASIAIDQAKITGCYARTSGEQAGYAWVFKAVFGPAGSKELEFVEAWRNTMRFVSFEEAEPNADFDEPEANTDDEPDDQPTLPDHEFETAADGAPIAARAADEPARQNLHSHTTRRARTARSLPGRRRKR